MVRRLLILVTSLATLAWGTQNSNRQDGYEEVLDSLLERFYIKYCLILTEFELPDENKRAYVRRFSRQRVVSAVLDVTDFMDIVEGRTRTYWNTAVILHLTNGSQAELLDKYPRLIPDINLIWIVLVSPGVKPLTDVLYVPLHCKFLIVKQASDSIFDVIEFYTLGNLRSSSKLGIWSRETNTLSITTTESFIERRRDFNGPTLIGTIGYTNGDLQIWYWRLLMEFYNFKSMVGTQKQIQEYGLASQALLMNYAIHPKTFDKNAVGPLATSHYYLFIKKPTEEKSFWMSYLRPFTMDAWVVITVSRILIAALGPILKRTFLKTSFPHNNGNHETVGVPDTLTTLLSSRIAFFATISFFALLQCLYSGELISYLTTHEYPLPFSDLEGLIEDGTYNITVEKMTHASQILLVDFGPVVEKYVRARSTQYNTSKEVENRLCNERVVLVEEIRMANGPNLKWPCEIVRLPQILQTTHSVLFLAPNSEFASVFRFALTWFRETGLQNEYHLEYYNSKQLQFRTTDLTEVDVPRIVPPFALLGLGIAMSVIIALLENLFNLYTEKNV